MKFTDERPHVNGSAAATDNPPSPASSGSGVDRAVEEYLALVEAGERPDRREFLAKHADLGPALAECLEALEFLRVASPGLSQGGTPAQAATQAETPRELGDFRIVREVGRGGMGVVYEAIQISLNRRVALKVLPFAATLDSRRLQRFKNEARAAGQLHHTNIVPVHAVGTERGVHYYAMQFIDGETLADVIRGWRGSAVPQTPPPAGDAPPTTAYAPPPAGAETTAVPTKPVAALTTERTKRDKAMYRRIAELGAQAAEALEHAHQVGIIHRDVKPANLMIDARGNLWVTDFGLAQFTAGESITVTGDLIGTLRYMSPEQALAKRVIVDQRTDIYSLGVTLYEMLALRPAFSGEDRHELLRQIAFEEPRPLRKLDKGIPAELETIVLRATAKNPDERYETAKELAEDLERFVRDEPIRARRPDVVQRLRRWGRRHPALVRSAAVIFVLVAGMVGWEVRDRQTRRETTEKAVSEALNYADDFRKRQRWFEAREAAKRAEGLIGGNPISARLRQEVERVNNELDMVAELERIREEIHSGIRDQVFNTKDAEEMCSAVFARYGLNLDGRSPGEAASCVRSCSLPAESIPSLDYWAGLRWQLRGKDNDSWQTVQAAAEAADGDDWRRRLRAAIGANNAQALKDLGASAVPAELPPFTLLMLGNALAAAGLQVEAVRFLTEAQRYHPDDFWINVRLGDLCLHSKPPQLEKAVFFHSIAVALRKTSPCSHNDLGIALLDKGQFEPAIVEFHQALHLKPDFFFAHNSLGNALAQKGRLDDAIAEYREALCLNPDFAVAHYNFGNALHDKGRIDDAIAEYREAIRLKPDLVKARFNLGGTLAVKGRLDDAIREYREALRLKPDYAEVHSNLGSALHDKGRLDDAIAECREALRLQPDLADAHNNLGNALRDKGRLDDAITECREALRLEPDLAEAHNNLGNALLDKGRLDDAIAEHREALRLKPDHALSHNNLGFALQTKGEYKKAVLEYQKALQLRPNLELARNNLMRAQRLLELSDKLPTILSGKTKPKDAAEAVALAEFCLETKHMPAAALRLYRDAFAADPKLAEELQKNRYNAACAAALAAVGQGKDVAKVDGKERDECRKQALSWLQVELKGWTILAEKKPPPTAAIAQTMRHWQNDADLAGVRGDQALAKLPEAERQAWQMLWADVAKLLQQAQAKAAALTPKNGPKPAAAKEAGPKP